MLAGDREVAEAQAQGKLADRYPDRRAVRAGEVQVEDDLRPPTAQVIVRSEGWDGGAAELSQRRRWLIPDPR
jgi:hypothetical protein